MFDPIHLAYVAAGLILGWIARSKMGDAPSKSPEPSTAPVDPLDTIMEMLKAEQERKSKLDQLRDILNPK